MDNEQEKARKLVYEFRSVDDPIGKRIVESIAAALREAKAQAFEKAAKEVDDEGSRQGCMDCDSTFTLAALFRKMARELRSAQDCHTKVPVSVTKQDAPATPEAKPESCAMCKSAWCWTLKRCLCMCHVPPKDRVEEHRPAAQPSAECKQRGYHGPYFGVERECLVCGEIMGKDDQPSAEDSDGR